MALFDNGRLTFRNGRSILLSEEKTDLRFTDDWVEYVRPFDATRAVTIRLSTENGIVLSEVISKRSVICSLDDDFMALRFSKIDFKSDGPIRSVVRSGALFVMFYLDERLTSMGSTICVDSALRIQWKNVGSYFAVNGVRDSDQVIAASGGMFDILDIKTGSRLSYKQDRPIS